jgi:hypothetical protein
MLDKPRDRKPPTPYTLTKRRNDWIAHSVAFDLVGADKNRDAAISQLRMCLIAQIGWGLKHGAKVIDCYFAAPPRYWNAPFEFMEMPTDAEIAELKLEEVGAKP